MIKEDFGSNCT